ncbi:MAG TPA: glycosyltransferase [Phototrophicaceae bacterium]|nr:glycosyltransferase [Phototrophicaceae bacterium]
MVGNDSLTIWGGLYLFFQYLILAYFVLVSASYTLLTYLGLRSILRYNRVMSSYAIKPLLESQAYRAISILVPAYNEEKSIIASVRSLLSLHYPVFEIIVVSDGSRDGTVDVLREAYHLTEISLTRYHMTINAKPIKRLFRSVNYPNLILVEKENGGKADALNVALNLARYPLVCSVDADSTLDVQALLRTAYLFVEDETVVAVGGTVRPLNGAIIQDGQLVEVRLPPTWIERLQIVEYSRAFFAGRAGWAEIGILMIISGAFGVFKRESVLAVGGYRTNTVGEDMDLVMRLHKYYLRHKLPYQIRFTPDPLCWTEVPSDLKTLRRQRNRWHRGLWENLWEHRDMLFNPRYGLVGLVGVPYAWLVEAASPAVELGGYVFFLLSILLGILNLEFTFYFMSLAILFGLVLSLMSIGIETLLLNRYKRISDRLIFIVAACVEFLGYRQILLWERFRASFQVWGKRGQWGSMERKGFR